MMIDFQMGFGRGIECPAIYDDHKLISFTADRLHSTTKKLEIKDIIIFAL